ncbi:hypothetical protein V8B55DRAFT_1514892 [Mucor lusitanicus]
MMKSFFLKKAFDKREDVVSSTLKKQALQGKAQAQYALGKKCITGKDQVSDHDRSIALDWFQKAAESGHGAAQHELALAYQHGLGTPHDPVRALQWFTESATTHDHGDAQYQLGTLYYYGICGVPQDYAMAHQWFLRASSNLHSSSSSLGAAQNSLGFLYQRGWGVEQDHHQALQWFIKAASNNNSNAQNQIGVYHKKGLGGLKVDHRLAFEWYSKSAKNGNSSGQCNLAWMYYDGYGTKQDYVKAMKWFLMAADKHSHDAQLQVGVMYLNGLGVKPDTMMALNYLTLAIENGNQHAQEYKDYLSGLLDNEKVETPAASFSNITTMTHKKSMSMDDTTTTTLRLYTTNGAPSHHIPAKHHSHQT